MVFDDLPVQNPWWSDQAWDSDDVHLNELEESPIKWDPHPVDGLSPKRVYSLRGPRQVGKTTALKSLVRRIIEDGAEPRSVFFQSCDLIPTNLQLAARIREYLSRAPDVKTGHRWIILDEISSVRHWARAIKSLHDAGSLRGAVVLLTGSHALDVRRETERLPGRRGEGIAVDELDRVLLPMSFREFIAARSREGSVPPAIRNELVDFSGGKPASVSLLALVERSESLDAKLAEYLRCGGFPRPTRHLARSGKIPREVYELHVRSVIGDIVRWGGSEGAAREVLCAIFEAACNPVSWRTLGSKTSIASHSTVSKYVEDLEAIYSVHVLPHFDPGARKSVHRKDRKVHLSDPFLFHALRSWAFGLPDPWVASEDYLSRTEQRGKLLEAVVAAHASRSTMDHRAFHWRSGNGEVDIVLPEPPKPIAIQVTASAEPEPRAFSPLRAFARTLMLASGSARLSGERRVLPVSSFLAGWV